MEKEKYPILLFLLILLMFIALGNLVKIKCKSSVKYHISSDQPFTLCWIS